jgi:transcriptional regulator with XRE-family HTH domain
MTHENFGLKLPPYAKSAGMTTKTLAQLVGVTPSYLTQIQKGNREPPQDLFERLAQAMVLGSGEVSELKRVLAAERLLRAIEKAGGRSGAAALAADILESDDGLLPEAHYRALG